MTKSTAIPLCLSELCGTEVTLDANNKGGGNYKYASLPHLQRIVMPVVKKHGLLLIQTVVSWDVEFRTIKVQKNTSTPATDKQFCLAKCELQTILKDPTTGECEVVTVYGSKADQSSGDKSLGAVTTAKRYGLAAMFNLILSDDDGGDTDATDNPFDLLGGSAPKKATPITDMLGGATAPAGKSSNPLDSILGM
jgi:hypothetical protein